MEPFASENALCEVLKDASESLEWVFYPEIGGWDCVLVLPDETQVGVQAKLRANVDVLYQTIVPRKRKGPDIHSVLVPTCNLAFRKVAEALGFAVLVGSALRTASTRAYLLMTIAKAPRTTHDPGRCWLPPFVPENPAGVPSPRAVSPWRVAAARLSAEIREGATPTNAEIKARGMSPSTWRQWLDPIPGTYPRRYALRPGATLPDVAFPEVARGLGLPEPQRARSST